jgi:AraC-like DNA-binding protein
MGSAFEGVTTSKFIGLTISISDTFLARTSEKFGLSLPDEILHPVAMPTRRNTAFLRQLGQTGRVLLYTDGAPFGEAQQEEYVADLIGAAADAEAFDDTSELPVRARGVRRALACIQDRADENVPVSELCVASGVSWRTLDRGFREAFDIGPKAYLLRYRLDRARRDLLTLRADRKVVDIANRWGFWHMGQFARDYRRMFGELPSVTLKGRSS